MPKKKAAPAPPTPTQPGKTWWNFPSKEVLSGDEAARAGGPIPQSTADAMARLMSSSGDIGLAQTGHYPIAFLKATKTPVYDVSGNEPHGLLDFLTGKKEVYGYQGNTLGALGSKGPQNMVLLNVNNRTWQESPKAGEGKPELDKTLAHEAIHVSQNMNQPMHDKIMQKVEKTLPWRALDNYIQQVYPSDVPRNETEAFLGSGTANPDMMKYLKAEGVTPEQMQAVQQRIASQYPAWLRMMQPK